ncbi:hypothetical protein [uncultured Polaribacter sp.]|uniref:hypothetical protein n=1 Tax=uncultured Polaribacter sp. TaxID=174711 RepID=UPI00262B6241|nr:hypothetical protein [uncultured Polaribacter sp.]
MQKNIIFRNKFKILLLTILFIAYYYSPYKVEGINFYHKIWAHRVNSIEKLNSSLNYFDGIELDLVYNFEKNIFDVNHPPDESKGLNFVDYINAIENNSLPFIWLDIKNINKKNVDQILKKLLLIFKSKEYPLNKILIESKNANLLLQFEKVGFKTSFYLPSNLNKKNSLDLSKSLLDIKNVINKYPNVAISTSFKDYHIVKKEFPNHKKYIWAIVKPLHFNHFLIREILKDTSVEIVLLNYHVIRGNI